MNNPFVKVECHPFVEKRYSVKALIKLQYNLASGRFKSGGGTPSPIGNHDYQSFTNGGGRSPPPSSIDQMLGYKKLVGRGENGHKLFFYFWWVQNTTDFSQHQLDSKHTTTYKQVVELDKVPTKNS